MYHFYFNHLRSGCINLLCFADVGWFREQSSVLCRWESIGCWRWHRTSLWALVALEVGKKLHLYS